MYVAFDGFKKAFVEYCKPLFGLDGCFLKGVHERQLLAIIGKDDNNQMLPIAYAIVEAKNKDLWKWFLDNLIVDIGSMAK